MRTHPTFIVNVGSIFKQLKHIGIITLQAPARNETNWIKRTREFNSSATAVRAAVALLLTLRLPRCVQYNWNGFSFWPSPSAESQLKLDLLYVICNGAVWGTGVAFQLLPDNCRAVHDLTTPVTACTQPWLPSDISSGLSKPDCDSESARLAPPKSGL
jgi:hypothetical protein